MIRMLDVEGNASDVEFRLITLHICHAVISRLSSPRAFLEEYLQGRYWCSSCSLVIQNQGLLYRTILVYTHDSRGLVVVQKLAGKE